MENARSADGRIVGIPRSGQAYVMITETRRLQDGKLYGKVKARNPSEQYAYVLLDPTTVESYGSTEEYNQFSTQRAEAITTLTAYIETDIKPLLTNSRYTWNGRWELNTRAGQPSYADIITVDNSATTQNVGISYVRNDGKIRSIEELKALAKKEIAGNLIGVQAVMEQLPELVKSDPELAKRVGDGVASFALSVEERKALNLPFPDVPQFKGGDKITKTTMRGIIQLFNNGIVPKPPNLNAASELVNTLPEQ
ncbi:MAG: hypothetical protein WCP97_08465 [bacterium]